MEFRLPKGELRWLAIIWLVVCGLGLPYAIYKVWITGILAFGFTLTMTLGICYGSRGCAITLLIMGLLAICLILVRDVIMDGNHAKLGRVLIKGYFVYALFDWLKREDD